MTTPSVTERITAYLCGGGLFNPEYANHDAVRDLLIDAKSDLAARDAELAKMLDEREGNARQFRRIQDRLAQAEVDAKFWMEVSAEQRAELLKIAENPYEGNESALDYSCTHWKQRAVAAERDAEQVRLSWKAHEAEEDAPGAIAEVHSDTLRWLISDDDPRRPIGHALLYTEDQLRAAVAAERERCAKVCEEHAPQSFTVDGIITRAMCAAAIRRGE